MTKPDIAKRLAEQSKSSVGEAADCLDRMVGEIVRKLKHGEASRLPGMGAFARDPNGRLAFQRERQRRD